MSHLIVVEEFCHDLRVERRVLVELVEVGILTPAEREPWRFDMEALIIARRALRLQRELELDWPGIAVALNLLDEVEQLRRENHNLRRRLQRFE